MTPECTSRDYRSVFEQLPIGIVVYGQDLRVLECNERFANLIGSSREQIIGLGMDELRDQRHRTAVLQALAGEVVTYESPYQATTSDAWLWVQATFGPLRNGTGAVAGALVTVSDRSAQVTTEHGVGAARPTQTQLGETERFGGIGSWTWDAERGVAAVSPELRRILGVSSDWMATPKALESLIHPEDRAELRAQLSSILQQQLPFGTREFRIVRPDEAICWVALRGEMKLAPDGAPISAWGLIQDMTERRLLEERLRQAQKMEAVGQLAAGVAHDFNNLLMVIRIESEFLDQARDSTVEMHESLRAIQSAVDHAAELTKQLLAFSRKQLLVPRLLDVNDAVAGATQMLRRLIGERIEVVTDLRPNLPPIFVDAGQLVHVLINLVVNARDAMPGGGRLTIATGLALVGSEARENGLPPGEHVTVTVRDTGHGMDQATRKRIFEPFFTTKAPGHGTGLGLSTVYGIVEQSAAHITMDSEPGRGTTFKLYFLPQPTESGLPRDTHRGPDHPGPELRSALDSRR